jgi:hypothetical protein
MARTEVSIIQREPTIAETLAEAYRILLIAAARAKRDAQRERPAHAPD